MNTPQTNIGYIFLLTPIFLALNYFDVVQWPIWVIVIPMVLVFAYIIYIAVSTVIKLNRKRKDYEE